MRRWNGWGDDTHDFSLNEAASTFLKAELGDGVVPTDITLEEALAKVPDSRLPDFSALTTEITVDAQERLVRARGQSFADWVDWRFGTIDSFPDGVAFPETREEVREVLRYAYDNDVVMIPYAGGTSVVGHLTPDGGGKPVLSVDMSRMSAILDLDEESHIAHVGAGVSGQHLEAKLRARGYTLGHFPQSFEYSTLGGWIVTKSSGQQSMRYGRIEKLFAGGNLETPVGNIEIPEIPAVGAGCDVREMIMGSEGRMGILTDAKVRITPVAKKEKFYALFFPSWEAGKTAARVATQQRIPLSMVRLSNPLETFTNLTMAGHEKQVTKLKWYLRKRGCDEGMCMMVVGATGTRRQVRQAKCAMKKVMRKHKGAWIGTLLGKTWAEKRFRGPYLRNSLWDAGYGADTVETSIPWTKVDGMMNAIEATAKSSMAQFGVKVHAFTHLSHVYTDGSSVYSTFIYPLGKDAEETLSRWKTMKAALCETIVANGGTISHQHGVGTDHKAYLAHEKSELGLEAIRTVMNRFDPEGLLNPGKLVD